MATYFYVSLPYYNLRIRQLILPRCEHPHYVKRNLITSSFCYNLVKQFIKGLSIWLNISALHKFQITLDRK